MSALPFAPMTTVLWPEDELGRLADTCRTCGLGLIVSDAELEVDLGLEHAEFRTVECWSCWVRWVAFRRTRAHGPAGPGRSPRPD